MSKRYRQGWPLLFALVLGVAGLIAIASIAPDGESGGDAAEPLATRYVEGIAGAPSRVNPLYVTSNDVDGDLSSLVFSGLARLRPDGMVEPDLAESWTLSEDGRAYTFILREGVRWHDGEPFDAADVVFTVATIQDPEFDGDASLAEVFDGVEVMSPDSRTVVMTLPEPFAPFLALGATTGLLPAHLLIGLEASGIGASPFNQRPTGTGPFRLTSLTPGGALLEANEGYHFDAPALPEIELVFFSDGASLVAALREGDSDIAGALLRPGTPREDLDSVTSSSDWNTRALNPASYSLVYLNPQFEAFTESDVRKALQHATDRQTLIGAALAGQAMPVNSPIPPGLWSSTPDEAAYAYDPARADALLNAAGWSIAEGVRTKDGEQLSFALSTSDDPSQTAVAQELARQWSEIGVNVTLEPSGASQFIEDVLLPRAFDAALVTIDPGADPDPYPFWHSSAAIGNGRNLAAFSNPYSDRLLEEARQATSVEERAEALASFQSIFAMEQPAVLLDTPLYHYVLPREIEGTQDVVLVRPGSRFYDIHRWRFARPAP